MPVVIRWLPAFLFVMTTRSDSAATPDAPPVLVGAHRRLDLSRTRVMGVLNVTPDSFSDGGDYDDPTRAIDHALAMVDQGASVIDIGGESSRPGAAPVSVDDELARVLPVVEGIRRVSDVFISLDTSAPRVIREGCAIGADMVNDIRGLQTDGAIEAVAATGAAACVMHMQGQPRDMQACPSYDDVVAEVAAFLDARLASCQAQGVGRESLVIDPGFGFGKTLAHNLTLMRALNRFTAERYPVLMGVSRKSMFAHLFGADDMARRINGSLGAAFWAVQQGVAIVRAHDVRETVDMVTLAEQLTAGRR